MRFNVLGPLEGWTNGSRLELGGPIQRKVLATLLLESGKMLTVPRLVTAAWDEEPPATASHQVRKAVADLRRRIPDGIRVLVTDGPGYSVAVERDQLDLHEFDDRVRAARTASDQGSGETAVELLRSALALWRGPALSGLTGMVLESAALALQERQIAAAERFFGLRLALGEASAMIGELRDCVNRNPLQETLRGQLMVALYRSGRRADALEEYGRIRDQLVEELGIDPGPHLVKLHEQILVESPELAAPEAAPVLLAAGAGAGRGAGAGVLAGAGAAAGTAPEPVPGSVPGEPGAVPAAAPPGTAVPGAVPAAPQGPAAETPRTLPYDLVDFVGREQQLRQLLVSARAGRPGTRIVAIDGMGGTGKTSLAVRAAYQLAAEYPDGQLYIDLRGYTPEEQPVNVNTALEVLLRALGLGRELIPDDVVGRTALWQSTLAGRRLLLLLDNAVDAAVVRRLLPSSSECLVLVTSRARLTDLDGAEWISIDVMPPAESGALITELLGAKRTAAEPGAAAELARLCGHLPLALRIATARLANRPLWSLEYLVERLRDEDRKLDELSLGERGVATTLRLSYQFLAEDCRTTFRLLSLHPGRDIDVHSAAALLAIDLREAEDHLERLLDAHLVHQPAFGLYAFHDLVRSFARSLSDQAGGAHTSAAVERMLDYYLTATEQACETLFPGRSHRPTGIQPSPARLPRLRPVAEAQSWFDREHITLVSIVNSAMKEGFHRHAVCLARNVAFYLNARGSLEEFAELSRVGVLAARRLGDTALLSVSLSNLGVACWKLGRHTEGIAVAHEGRDLALKVGDRHTQAHTEGTLGLYKSLQGRFQDALDHLEVAVALEHELGTPRAEAESRTVLSAVYEQWGRYREAAEAARRAVALVRQLSHHETTLVALTDLAFAHVGMGECDTAEDLLREARELCDETKEPGQVAMTLALSADLAHRRGDLETASAHADQALELIGTSASPLRRAKVENMLGRLLLKRRDHSTALRLHANAHQIASAIGYRVEEAYALSGMSRAAAALGDEPAAAEHGAAAEEIFQLLGVQADCRRY